VPRRSRKEQQAHPRRVASPTAPAPRLSDYVTERFTELALDYGVDTFIIWPAQDVERQIERFAAEVIPAVREPVAKR
jgi:hypothetical protein